MRIMDLKDTENIPITSFTNPSAIIPIGNPLRFPTTFRGTVPISNNRPDNVLAYYMRNGYRSQRTTSPNVSNNI